MSTRFERDTAVARQGEGFDVRIDAGWWVLAGPNGGYLAALFLRALDATVGDPERVARSLTLHYTAVPVEGPARVETRVERRGRALTTVSGRIEQDGQLIALGLAAFSKPRREGHDFSHARMPEVPPPEGCPPLEERIPLHARYEQRHAVGALPFAGAPEALSGGWIRLAEPHRVDAPLAALFSDSFPPALFATLSEPGTTRGVPTIDLTVHFRSALPLPDARPGDWSLACFRTRQAREGFLEEDGEIWSQGGVLLAQSRQLALAR